jgi:hypothetical protein
MGLSNWPTVTDDDGSYAVGTVFNKALTDAIKASIEADLFSAANPSVTAENIIDEVIAARGSKTDLDARLDVAMNEDGTLKAQAGQATTAQVQSIIGQGNWVQNDNLLIWAKGDSVAPTGYTLTTVACAAETTEKKVGPRSAKLTRSGSDGSLSQDIMPSGSLSAYGAYFKGRTMAFGCWVKTSVASCARVQFDDGVTTSETSYHPGDGSWKFLSTTHTLSASATKMSVKIQVLNSNGDVYVSGLTALPGTIAVTEWCPCPTVIGTILWKVTGTVATDTVIDQFSPTRPSIIKDCRLVIGTAPTDASLIVDINQWDGDSWESAFTTKPQLATTKKYSVLAEPDGTYANRCFAADFGNTATASLIGWDIDQVGSTEPGVDLWVHVRLMQYVRPQESMLEVDATE